MIVLDKNIKGALPRRENFACRYARSAFSSRGME